MKAGNYKMVNEYTVLYFQIGKKYYKESSSIVYDQLNMEFVNDQS